MSDPVNIDPDADEVLDPDAPRLPVEIDLETPEADLLEQSLEVEFDADGYQYG